MNQKKRKKRRWMCMMMATLLLLSACGKMPENNVESEETVVTSLPETSEASADGPGWKLDTSPITFTILIADSSFTQKWEKIRFHKLLQKKRELLLIFQFQTPLIHQSYLQL